MDVSLRVFADGKLAGALRRPLPEAPPEFAYDDDWDGVGISLSLPRKDKTFRGALVDNFFANLLPEGAFRDALAMQAKVPPDDALRLLSVIGGECAGALQILPEGVEPYPSDALLADGPVHELEVDEAEDLVSKSRVTSFAAGNFPEGRSKLSLAGAQGKLPIRLLAKGRIAIPLEGAPSTHILKIPPVGLDPLVHNELFCMRLAGLVGIAVPRVDMLMIAGKPVFVAARYDRSSMEGRIRRLHQEDFCQALGISHKLKYQGHGGPGFGECRKVLLRTAIPATNINDFLRLSVFNVLIGNYDAHAKNYALLYHSGLSGAPRLAPGYDLVCIYAFGDRYDQVLAMSVGEQNIPGHLTKSDWSGFAKDMGVKPILVENTVKDTAQRILEAAPKLADELTVEYGFDAEFKRICSAVEEHLDLVGFSL